MKAITRNEFVKRLTENTSLFMGNVRNMDENRFVFWTLESLTIIDAGQAAKRRTVTENHVNFIIFSDGSRLDFNQAGKNDYFEHTNQYGIKYAVMRTTVQVRDWQAEEKYWDEHGNFDCGELYKEQHNYIVYVIIEADKDISAKREFRCVDIAGEAEKMALCKWLKANGYYYEVSKEFDKYHLEVLCSERETDIINGKIDELIA